MCVCVCARAHACVRFELFSILKVTPFVDKFSWYLFIFISLVWVSKVINAYSKNPNSVEMSKINSFISATTSLAVEALITNLHVTWHRFSLQSMLVHVHTHTHTHTHTQAFFCLFPWSYKIVFEYIISLVHFRKCVSGSCSHSVRSPCTMSVENLFWHIFKFIAVVNPLSVHMRAFHPKVV